MTVNVHSQTAHTLTSVESHLGFRMCLCDSHEFTLQLDETPLESGTLSCIARDCLRVSNESKELPAGPSHTHIQTNKQTNTHSLTHTCVHAYIAVSAGLIDERALILHHRFQVLVLAGRGFQLLILRETQCVKMKWVHVV
jgi:hypothetical protein